MYIIRKFQLLWIIGFIWLGNLLPMGRFYVLSKESVPYVHLLNASNDELANQNLWHNVDEKLDSLAKTMDVYRKNMNSIMTEIEELKSLRQNVYDNSLKQLAKRKAPLNILEVKCANDRLPENCLEVSKCQNNLFLISISNLSESSFPVSCDFETDNSGWTVIQRRQDGSVDFNRNWTEYVQGFGDLNGEFFIGLEKLHALTALGAAQELYIILEDFEGVRRYAKYDIFRVESQDEGYKLKVANYMGDAGDSFSQHSGYTFSTWDRVDERNCAKEYHSGWWYTYCSYSNLNGKYLMGKLKNYGGVEWGDFRGYKYSLKFAQMMIRPRANKNN